MKNIINILYCLFFCLIVSNSAKAQCPAGQTEVTFEIVTSGFPSEIGYELVNTTTGDIVACQITGTFTAGGTFIEGPFCLNDGDTYEFVGYDSFGDDWNGGYFNAIITEDGSVNGCGSLNGCALIVNGGENLDIAPDVSVTNSCETSNQEFTIAIPATACDASAIILTGCTNPAAANYNPCANTDDGTCIIPATNDDVTTAIPICGATITTGSNVNATTDANDLLASCIGSLENTVWFSLESDGTPLNIDVTESVCSDNSGLQVVLLSGDVATGYVEEACETIDNAGVYTLDLAAPVFGETYYVYIDGVAGDECNISVVANTGAASCCGPEYTVNSYCVPGDEANFYADVVITDLGTDLSGYNVNGQAITATGTYQFGPFPNGTNNINITGITETDCIIDVEVANDCACDPNSITVTTPDVTINAGDAVDLMADAGLVLPGGFLGYVVDAQPSGCSFAPSANASTITDIGAIGDDSSAPVTLPFTFPFFENNYTNLLISSNGYITFGTNGTSLSNTNIPNTNDPNDIISLFWDDLTVNGTGAVAYFTDIINGQNCLVITYNGIEHLGGGGESVTGQIVICEDGAITVTCLNCQTDGGFDVAIQGIENADGTEGYFDPALTDGQFTAGGTLQNCVTFTPNNAVPSACTTIGWVTDLNDIAGSLVGNDFTAALSVSPTVTTTYYAIVECNYFEGATLTCVDEVTITVDNTSTCSITPLTAANIVCNDNGTEFDDTDDSFTFDIVVNGDNTDPAASDTFIDDEGNIGAYGDIISYGPFPIASGNVTISFTDAEDVNCVNSMMVTPPASCSSGVPTGDVGISDPCDCTDTRNLDILDETGAAGTDGTYDFFYEEIEIVTTPAITGITDWAISTATGNFFDASGNIAPLTITESATPGTYTVSFYLEAGGLYSAVFTSATENITTPEVSGGGCVPCESIPTLSEWGLIVLALLMMTYGTVTIASGSFSLASTGNIKLPVANNFSLPVNKSILQHALMVTALLAIIGFVICASLYGTIFMSDIIGVAFAGPIFAYLLHIVVQLISEDLSA